MEGGGISEGLFAVSLFFEDREEEMMKGSFIFEEEGTSCTYRP